MLKSYIQKPQEIEISEPENGAVKVTLRENIVLDGTGGCFCNEYILTASAENIHSRVKRQRAAWIEQAKASEAKRGEKVF